MFKELVPLLRNRVVLMTLALVEDDKIRDSFTPKRSRTTRTTLPIPVVMTGTAEELEAEVGPTLVGYTGAHLQLKNTLDKAREEMDAAAKAVKAEAQSKSRSPLKKETTASTSAKPPQAAKPAEPAKPAPPKTADQLPRCG
jgi:PRTRC genetic system protein E